MDAALISKETLDTVIATVTIRDLIGLVFITFIVSYTVSTVKWWYNVFKAPIKVKGK